VLLAQAQRHQQMPLLLGALPPSTAAFALQKGSADCAWDPRTPLLLL
jgi:hypothetical protein